MLIMLTDADNGQIALVRASAIAVVRVLDPTRTLVVFSGAGEMEVRESVMMINKMIREDELGPAPRTFERGVGR